MEQELREITLGDVEKEKKKKQHEGDLMSFSAFVFLLDEYWGVISTLKRQSSASLYIFSQK